MNNIQIQRFQALLQIKRRELAESNTVACFYGIPIEELDRDSLLFAVYRLLDADIKLRQSAFELNTAKVSRHLPGVIDQLLEIIPDTEKLLISKLKTISQLCGFLAPEFCSNWWQECADALNEASKYKTGEEWVKIASQVFNNQIKENFGG